jgi:hypothetical protein
MYIHTVLLVRRTAANHLKPPRWNQLQTDAAQALVPGLSAVGTGDPWTSFVRGWPAVPQGVL